MDIESIELLRSHSGVDRERGGRAVQTKSSKQSTFTCLELAEKAGGRHDILFAGRSDGHIVFWKLQERNLYGGKSEKERKDELLVTANGHKGSVTCLSYSHRKLLLSCSADATIKVWDPLVFAQEHCVQTLFGHGATVTAVVESLTRTLVSASIDCTVKIWKPQGGRDMLVHPFFECIRTVDMEGAWATAAAIYGAEEWTVFVGDSEGNMTLFNQARSRTRREKEVRLWKKWLHVHRLGITQIKMVPDQNFLLSVSFDCTCRVLDALTGQLFVTVENPARRVRYTGAAWDKVNELLVVCDADGDVEAWNTYTETCLIKKNLVNVSDDLSTNPAGLAGIVAAGKGHFFAMSPSDDVIHRGMVIMHTECQEFTGHTDAVIALVLPACSAGLGSVNNVQQQEMVGGYVISCSLDNTIKCWDGSDSDMFNVNERFSFGQRQTEFACMISIPELNCLITGNDDGSIWFWDAHSGAHVSVQQHGNTVSCLCYIQTYRDMILVSSGFDGSVAHWTLAKSKNGLVNPQLENKIENAHDIAEPEIIALVALQHIPGFVTGGNDRTLRIWKLDDQRPFAIVNDLEDSVNCLAVDGFFLFSGNHRGVVQIWNMSIADQGVVTELGSFRAHNHSVRDLIHVPVFGYLVTCGTEGFIRIWDYTTTTFNPTFSSMESEGDLQEKEALNAETESTGEKSTDSRNQTKFMKEFHRADKDIKCIACQIRSNRSMISILAGCQDGEILRFMLPVTEPVQLNASAGEKMADQIEFRESSLAKRLLEDDNATGLKGIIKQVLIQNREKNKK